MTELPPLYGYYIVREPERVWNEAEIAYGTCALEVMLTELEKGNVIIHIRLRDHD
jgi:hypothetical protein